MISKLISRLALSAVAAGVLAVATPAAASTVTLTRSDATTKWAQNDLGHELYAGVNIHFTGRTDLSGVRAGAFGINDGTNDWLAFCVDLFESYALGSGFMPEVNPVRPFMDRLDKLYTTYFADVDTGTEAAAFQVAIWEIIYDSDLNVGDGSFKLTSTGSVLTQVNTYLSGLDDKAGGGYAFTFLNKQGAQDLVIASPVPLPAGGLLLLGALGAMGVARRKAKQAA